MNKKHLAMLASVAITLPTFSSASVMLDGLGGPTGYGESAFSAGNERNDDGSSGSHQLPFEINYFGTTYSEFIVNNNGNITFNGGVSTWTPQPFPVASQPMIAPYWADVDTRCDTCGGVYVAGDQAQGIVTVTWDKVGYYDQHSDLTNSFQLVLIDRSDTGNGNFDVEFRYDNLSWTTGDASGGVGGFGDPTDEFATPAQAGYDAGDGINYFALPGSFTEDVIDLATTSNTGEDGVWRFAIREGELPGATPENPLMPVTEGGNWEFDFNVQENETIFIDPDVAIGYDYVVDSGPNFRSVTLPAGFDDDIFQVIFDGQMATVNAGQEFFFGADGVSEFRVTGIDIANMIDPSDTNAFVTGLSFVSSGDVSMRQIPITQYVPGPSPVPEPAPLLLVLPFVLVMWLRKQKLSLSAA
ncbi:nidogen [Neiella sp. HB171785]|uniref:Nidogen n=1 Tax=Neiella litorisoli TaxID=2771431 RepID=A0A8J6UJ26_9GAMM|nr:nidogen-like domain-containing protein [Neiella litorisoli]MBD1389778.1 nidogen [Neiella litorisoli]